MKQSECGNDLVELICDMQKYLVFFVLISTINTVACSIENVTLPTNECALTAKDYDRRAQRFNCTPRKYICILNNDGALVETCMWDHPIGPGKDGCPYLVDYNEDAGPLIDGRHSICNITGCPQKNHQGYSLSELYKYPACFLPMNERTIANLRKGAAEMSTKPLNNTNEITENRVEESQYGHGQYLFLIILIPGLSIVCMIFFIVGYSVYNTRGQKKTVKNGIVMNDIRTDRSFRGRNTIEV